MICTISFTICGLKTSPLVSSLDKHMPWISGHQQRNKPKTQDPVIRKITSMPPMNCRVLPTSTFRFIQDVKQRHACTTPAKSVWKMIKIRTLKKHAMQHKTTQALQCYFTLILKGKSLNKTGIIKFSSLIVYWLMNPLIHTKTIILWWCSLLNFQSHISPNCELCEWWWHVSPLFVVSN